MGDVCSPEKQMSMSACTPWTCWELRIGAKVTNLMSIESFKKTWTRSDGRYEVSVPWIPGAELSKTNEEPSRKRLKNIERKLSHDKELREAYEGIV